jgi:hypothetical protein
MGAYHLSYTGLTVSVNDSMIVAVMLVPSMMRFTAWMKNYKYLIFLLERMEMRRGRVLAPEGIQGMSRSRTNIPRCGEYEIAKAT